MRLSELLNSKAVSLRLAARTKREALVELVPLLESAHGFKSQCEILDRVRVRAQRQHTDPVGNGGREMISSGGLASGTIVSGGGNEFVSAGGTARGATIASGGRAYVSSGGVASAMTVSAGVRPSGRTA